MEPLYNFLKLKIVRIFIIASILIATDATYFNDDYNFKYPEAEVSIPPLNGYPYGLPTPLAPPPPPLPSLPPLLSPAVIPPPTLFTPPATPTLMVPPPPPSTIKSPPRSFTPKPIGPPSSSPGPNLPSPALPPPPPPHKKPQFAVWCVAKPTVPDSAIQAALDYACGSGADCKAIQPNGPCFQPNTLLAHASYAFNSYWQNNKAGGGTCDFGGSAMLVTVDPSYNKCSFIFK